MNLRRSRPFQVLGLLHFSTGTAGSFEADRSSHSMSRRGPPRNCPSFLPWQAPGSRRFDRMDAFRSSCFPVVHDEVWRGRVILLDH